MVNKTKNGFTLAEVLITLVIIGVVAGLTIPSAINKYQRNSMAKRLKANYSILQQAINNSQANLENPNWVKEFDNAPIGTVNTNELIKKHITSGLRITKDYGLTWPVYISGQPIYHDFNGNQISPTSSSGSIFNVVSLANGTFLYMSFANNSNSDGTYALPTICVDVNGWKKPNVLGKDLFCFILGTNRRLYLPGYNKPRNTILTTCSHSASMYAVTCQSLVQHDNWEIKDDYPWW